MADEMDYDEGRDDAPQRERIKSAVTAEKKIKGRGHKDVSDVEDRYRNTKFRELDPNTKAGPTASVEGWVVFITGLHEETQEEDVQDAFAEFGEVKNLYLNLDRQTGFVKGYALVEYKSQKEAQAAITQLDGKELLTAKIHVEWAFKKPAPRRR